jgi:hypothetical protein
MDWPAFESSRDTYALLVRSRSRVPVMSHLISRFWPLNVHLSFCGVAIHLAANSSLMLFLSPLNFVTGTGTRSARITSSRKECLILQLTGAILPNLPCNGTYATLRVRSFHLRSHPYRTWCYWIHRGFYSPGFLYSYMQRRPPSLGARQRT